MALLLEHPVLLAVGLLLLLELVLRTVPGRIGAVAGTASIYVAIRFVDVSTLLQGGAWVARNLVVALVCALLLVGGLVVADVGLRRFGRTQRPLAIALRGAFGFVAAGTLVLLAVFGVAFGALGLPIEIDTDAPAIRLSPGQRYVALGDSYSAGEGLAPYVAGTNDDENNCHRSSQAFAYQLTFEPERPNSLFPACSGARSADVFKPRLPSSHDDVPPQVFPGILGEDVGLVTISMGGNDVHFSDILEHCFTHSHCLDETFDIGPYDANDAGLPPPAPLREWAEAALAVVGERLTTVFQEIRRLAPNARVVVLGYPRLFPTDRTLRWGDCGVVLRQVDGGEREGLNELQAGFNHVIYEAAATADLEYIDPVLAFAGHEACGPLGGMINAVRLSGGQLHRGAFHPTATGQRVFARLVACYLAQNPEPRRGFNQIDLGDVVIDTGLKPAPGTFIEPIRCP